VPGIRNPRLTVTPERAAGRATVRVTCDIWFTEFEVNAMNRLGLRYLLACQLVNRYFFYDRSVVTFLRQEFPRTAMPAVQQEHAVFETLAPLRDLHLFVSGDDTFVAELTLTNQETGGEVGARSHPVAVDLAA
jgi:hypothetical protein